MKASLRALLTNAIDYAGLFPPAKLPLEPAIQNFQRYRTEAESWMLGRFICPTTRLGELATLLAGVPLPAGAPPVSALGRGGKTAAEFLENTSADVRDLAATRQMNVGAFETRLPDGLTDVAALAELMAAVVARLRQHGAAVVSSHFEVALTGNWQRALETAAAAVGLVQGSQAPDTIPHLIGLKLRCGGLEPAAFPSVEQVALVLRACRDAGSVPLKFTAGLHHPIRHFNAGVGAPMHGFLNVLTAAALAQLRGLKEAQLVAVLAEESAQNFHVSDQELGWGQFRLTEPELRVARLTTVGSFGSCSFDQPRDDLRALGLL